MSKEEIFDPLECGYYENCREEGFLQGYECAIEEFEKTKIDVLNWLVKRQTEGYGTTNGELLDHIYEIAEKLKDKNNG